MREHKGEGGGNEEAREGSGVVRVEGAGTRGQCVRRGEREQARTVDV